MKKAIKKIDNIISWVLLIAVCVALVFSIFNVIQAKKTGEPAFLFGYRPVFVLTGSMEPYMLTNSICITKEVNSMDEIEVGDVVTFHSTTSEGKTINITHRIINITEDGYINTKGDNNRVDDNLFLTIENIDAKVITVFNQSAWIIAKWQSTTGKIMIISFVASIILLYFAVKSWIKYLISKKNGEAEENAAEEVAVEVDANSVTDSPAESLTDSNEAYSDNNEELPDMNGEAESEKPE